MTNFNPQLADEASLSGVFRNTLLGRGINPNSIFGRIQGAINPQAQSAFQLQNLFNPGNSPQDFQSFLGNGTGGINRQGIQGTGLNLLRQIAGYGNQAQPNNAAASLFQSAEPGNAQGTDLENLARLGIGQRYAPVVAGRYGGALVNQAQDQFQGELAANSGAGAQGRSYAEALLALLGLGG